MTTAHPQSERSAFWDQHVFSVGQADFQWIDVAIAAMVHGEWPSFERRLTEGLACAARAEAERYRPDEAAVDEAATAFRYERDLISGADMGAWLDRAGLSTDEWMAFLWRDVLRRVWARELDDVLDRFTPSPRRLAAAAVAEGICSGLFDQFEASFAGRVSVALERHETTADQTQTPDTPSIEAEAARLARQHAHWLTVVSGDDVAARLVAVLRIEARFRDAIPRLVSARAMAEALEIHHLQWVRVTVDTIAFDAEHAAREAVLCVSADGLTLGDVGALSRRGVARAEIFVEDVLPPHRDRFLSADIGQVLGPLLVDGRFEVTAVVDRAMPTLDDERVVERARHAAIAHITHRAAREHVRRRVAG